jgi:hypothetical protein
VSPGLRLPALILNESAIGFAVLVDTPTQLQPDDLASLETEGTRHHVRVVRTEDVPGGQAIGLTRLSEDDDPPPTLIHWRGLIPHGLLLSPWALVVMAGVFVIAAVLATFSLGFLGTHDYGETRVIGNERRAKSAKPVPVKVRVGSGSTTGSPESTFESTPERKSGGRKAPRSKLSRQASRTVDKLSEQAARDLPSPHALAKLTALAPERLEQWREQLASLPWEPSQLLSVLSLDLAYLNLTAHQQEAIASVVRRVMTDLNALSRRTGSDAEKAQQARQLETDAVQKITSLFTPQQRAQWQAMSIDSQSAAAAR